jgi:cytochrome P450 family 142 subfamily A polypeptide 1
MSRAGRQPMPGHPTRADIRLTDGDFYASEPFAQYAWMRAVAPVYFDGTVWGIARHDDLMTASKDSETFCNRHGMRPDSPPIPSMINLDDPEHRRRRGLVNKGFTPRRVADHEPKVRAICRELIAKVAPHGRCDFVRDVAAPLPMIMIGDMLGVAPEDRDMLLTWSDDLIKGSAASAPVELQMGAMKAFEEYAAYNRKVVADRRRRGPGDDLMSILTHAEIDGERLDDEELLQESLLILIGGDETTRHVLTGGMEQLIRNQDERRKLLDDPGKIPLAVEEMLRWVTPIKNMARTATRDVELRGETIRAGDKVLLLYHSANRDEGVFDRPERFVADRQPNPHVAFGGYGAHFCLGASLARLELRVMFEEVLRALPDAALASDAALPLRPSNFIVGIEHMPIAFTPRDLAEGTS